MALEAQSRIPFEKFHLINKKDDSEQQWFPKFKESALSRIRNNAEVTKFDMSKLEVEWDYDTDADQIKDSHSMLYKDLCAAVDFFVKENPLNLVENTNI